MRVTIETVNLKLVQCDIEMLKAGIAGNENLAKELGVIVPDNWTEFGTGALQYTLDKLSKGEGSREWWGYFPVHKRDNKLIGSGGYKGEPTAEGVVELGYEIAPEYRNQGLATEMTKSLIDNAFKSERVKQIIAHTLAHENPSTKVLTKCGFEKVAEINDPEDGLIWRWEIRR